MTKALIDAVNNIFLLFLIIILVRCLLSWVPNLDWTRQPWFTIRQVADAYLNLFRRFIPPIGGLDASPIVAIIALQLLQYIVVTILLILGQGL